jgi:phosphatidylserine/phosphatidylglycerophosphate/cardiolipin synthase-like enzyme
MKLVSRTAFALATTLLLACGGSDSTPSDEDDGDGAGASGQSGPGGPGSGGAGQGGGATTGGTGSGGEPAESCDPFQARTDVPELFVGPNGVESKIVGLIDAATTSVDLMMYQFNRYKIGNALIAAKDRGLKVRVLLDGDQYTNDDVKADLLAAGVEVKDAPATFEHAHAKVLLLDGQQAVIFSGNYNSYSMSSERNYGVIDRSKDDVADAQAIFEADWSGAPMDISCTRLIVTPENARERMMGLIDGAQQSLDLAIMYISDDEALDAIMGRAQAGVPVRVLLASPGWIEDNVQTAAQLESAGVQAKYLTDYELHAKLVVADGTAFVGSVNLSWNALEANREIGVFVTETEPVTGIKDTFESDWASGVNP